MTLNDLQDRIRSLATLHPNMDPLISCYIDLESGPFRFRQVIDARLRDIQASLDDSRQDAFLQARMTLESVLARQVSGPTRGLAVFTRGGRRPFLEVIELQTPVETHVSAGPTAQLLPLVEAKDTYERYVILIATETFAKIVEVDVGKVTSEIWTERPELRKAVGRGWTREHYQNHRKDRGNRFVNEKIRILEEVMRDSRHDHLILAGSSDKTAQIRRKLPKWISEKLVDIVPASSRDTTEDIVTATLSSFAEYEMEESLRTVGLLRKELATGGLAVAGAEATILALEAGQVDILVISSDFESKPGRRCGSCGHFHVHMPMLHVCDHCGSHELVEADLKAEVIRKAEATGVDIEFVKDSDFLMHVEGIGCLLRYLTPEQITSRSGAPLPS